MNEKIKEYLDSSNFKFKDVDENGNEVEMSLSEMLQDLIETNNRLGIEIERLTQGLTLLTNKLIDMTKEKEKYKSRNEKAIELIKMYDGKTVLRDYYDRDLLNILQGSDKEC